MANVDRLDPSNAEDVKHIRKMILPEDVNDNHSIDDGMVFDKDHVEPREGDSESAEDSTLDDDCCNEVYVAENCFIGKDQMKWGRTKSSTHIRQRGQNTVAKLPGVIGQSRNATASLETWNCLITDKLLDNTIYHTNQYILIIQPNFSRERDAKLIDETELRAFIGLLYVAGVLWSKTQSVEELWGTDGNGIENFR
jgi:hypothetical protein